MFSQQFPREDRITGNWLMFIRIKTVLAMPRLEARNTTWIVPDVRGRVNIAF